MLNFVIEMQTFLSMPKFNKKLLYPDANTLYQHFMNAFAYNQMVLTTNPSPSKPKLVEEGNEKWREIKKKGDDIIQEEIRILLNTPIPLQAIGFIKNSSRNSSRPSNLVSTPLSSTISKEYEIRPNAAAQKASYEKIKTARNKITEFESLYNIASDTSIRSDLAVRIQEQKDIVGTNDKKIEALKRHAANQARMMAKKQKQLEEEGIVEQWEGAGRPSILAQNPDLLEHIHNCIEYGEADKKRRKIIIKVRTIKHLKDKLEEKYNLYISRQTLSTYLWPKHPNTFAAKRHHHPALVQIQSVSWNEKSDHPDSHYCLASVKSARTFAATFHDHSIIISQNDKSKVPLGISAVGRTFKSIKTINMTDHNEIQIKMKF